MLALTRKQGETVRCVMSDGRELSVTVLQIRGDKIRLAFEAPADVSVDRQEVYDARQQGVPVREAVRLKSRKGFRVAG